MSVPSDHGGLASNDRGNMTRNPAANVQTRSTAGSVCNWTPWRENQLVKLISVCDPSLGLGANNRKYYEPSAPRRIPFYSNFLSFLPLKWHIDPKKSILDKSNFWSIISGSLTPYGHMRRVCAVYIPYEHGAR